MTELSIIDRLERLMHDLRLEYQEYIELREIRYEVERLQAENASLRERLEKAIELKAKVGDVIYIPWNNDGKDAIAELPISKISVYKDNLVLYWVDLSKCDEDYMWTAPKPNYTHSDFGSAVFLTPEDAEAHLAELKEGVNE